MLAGLLMIVLAQAAPEASPHSVTQPEWMPVPAEATRDPLRYYPKVAQQQGVEGRAAIECVVTDAGILKDCKILEESPTGFGFGDAAVGMSVLFRMKPLDKAGLPTSGGVVRIPIAFKLPGGEQNAQVVPPDWRRKPTGEDIARVYPDRASRARLDGQATVQCTTTATGELTDCVILDETPEGYGFGEATLRLAKLFRMRPLTRAGVPVGGGTVKIPIRFRLPR